MKALRLYYNKDGQIIWLSGLEGTGDFPRTIGEEFAQLPLDTDCIVITDQATIDAVLISDTNLIQDGKLIVGEPRPVPSVVPSRDLAAEIDALKLWAKTKGYIEIVK